MFFRKKKETDVDVLQKIKDKIVEDEKKNSGSGQKNAVADAVEDELVSDEEGADKKEADVAEIGRSVLENVSQIVDKAIQDNNDKQNQFENSLESDFLNDVFAIADAEADEVVNASSNKDGEETNAGADANATNTEDDEVDGDAGSSNFDDELDGDDLKKDEDALLDDDNATEDIETLIISGDRTDDKEKHTEKQEQKMLAGDDKKTHALIQNKDEKNDNQVVQKADVKKEETQPVAKSDEDALLDDDNATEEIETLVISGGDDVKAENTQTSPFIKEEIKATDASDIASSVGNIAEKQVEQSNTTAETSKATNIETKEENITFPNVPTMVKNDNTERKNVVSNIVGEKDVLHNDEDLSINNNNDVHTEIQKNKERQMTTSGISQQTQKGVKTSITDLIENVKNQIMQNNRSMASRGSRSDGGKTMEQFVADLVQPHIVRYLDGNLERIVNNIVQKEIKKIIDDVEGE